MRILLCRSNPVAPDPRVEKEARALVEAGYEVLVIGWDRTASLPSLEKRDGYEIHRIKIPSGYGTGISNLRKLLTWQVRLLLWLLRHGRGSDVLHACDFDTVLPGFFVKALFGKKLVFDIFDLYSDHLRNVPQWIRNVIRFSERWAINRADAVIVVDDHRREQIKDTLPKRLAIIYNSPEDVFSPSGGYQPSPPGSLRLAYIGLFQRERSLFEILSILKRHPEWSLEMAGFGGDEREIMAAGRELPNVHLHGPVSYARALELSSQADVLFAIYDPAVPNHRYSSPNKLFEAMMLGKPIIVGRDTNMDRIVLENDCGIVVTYGRVDELEGALLNLAGNPGLRQELGENARRTYDSLYNWDIMKTRLIAMYSQVLLPNG